MYRTRFQDRSSVSTNTTLGRAAAVGAAATVTADADVAYPPAEPASSTTPSALNHRKRVMPRSIPGRPAPQRQRNVRTMSISEVLLAVLAGGAGRRIGVLVLLGGP